MPEVIAVLVILSELTVVAVRRGHMSEVAAVICCTWERQGRVPQRSKHLSARAAQVVL